MVSRLAELVHAGVDKKAKVKESIDSLTVEVLPEVNLTLWPHNFARLPRRKQLDAHPKTAIVVLLKSIATPRKAQLLESLLMQEKMTKTKTKKSELYLTQL